MTDPTIPAEPVASSPLTVAAVLTHYGWPETDRAGLVVIVGAVNLFVRRACDLRPAADGGYPAEEDVMLGALMLAGRLHKRRNTPTGIEAFAEGATSYVRRNDPDVGLLLRLGRPRLR